MGSAAIALAEVVALETRVWEALRHGDGAEDGRLLAPDFLGVYTTGFADRAAHVAQLANGPTVADFALRDTRLLRVSDDDVLLCYRADWRRPRHDATESMFISSLWSRRGDEWVNVFSQDTPNQLG